VHIVYYITSHGYGHGVRSAAIANALSPGVDITFRTALPERFFREEVRRNFTYAGASFDCGCVQKDSLTIDIARTLSAYREIAAKNASLLESEAYWLAGHKADVVVSDITPFAFEAASRCIIPSVGVSNFTWYDIYAEYLGDAPAHAPDVMRIRAQYEMADMVLALNPSLPMPYFRKRIAVPVVGRSGRNRRAEIFDRYRIDQGKHLGLIYLGQLGIEGMAWRKLAGFSSWEFLGIEPLPEAPANYHLISKSDFLYQDLVASVDVMICKIGYGAVAESMLHGTPIIYLPRDRFAEYPVLHAAVRSWGGGCCLPRKQFCLLEWHAALDEAVLRQAPPSVPSGGARRCAELIEALAGGRRTAGA
jgi:hypothetical protein